MAESEALEAEAARGLTKLAEGIADELGGPPRLAELLEVVGWGAESLRKLVTGDPPLPLVLMPQWRSGVSRPQPLPSRAGELNDHAFVDAGDLLSGLAKRLAASKAYRPTVGDVVHLLGQGLCRVRPELLDDHDPTDLKGLTVESDQAPERAEIGDILAIPARDGGHFLAVVLDRNAFGTALGLFEGTHPPRAISAAEHPPVVNRPVYVGEEPVASGRWRVVGHDDDLVELFPAKPEIFHRPDPDLLDDSVGPHGAAETPDRQVRQLSERESREIGIFDPDFNQIYLGEQLEDRLNKQRG
jgi:hypothetical protein